MYPKFPLAPGESLISWANRFGRFHCDLDLLKFLTLIRVPKIDVVRGKQDALRRLADISGFSLDTLEAGVCVQVSEKQYRYQREQFNCDFIHLNALKFCPACLLNEIDNGKLGVLQIKWSFSPIRTCRVHNIPLVKQRSKMFWEIPQDILRLTSSSGDLNNIWKASRSRKLSALQEYVDARLDKIPGPSWLDSQPIDVACKATEMFGACIEFGADVSLVKLSEYDWNTAGNIGFGFTSRGEDGIREGLDHLLATNQKISAQSGPQAILGQLYKWLQFKKNDRPVGPISDLVREYILDNFPVQTGTLLLGAKVDRQRTHSIATLAAKFDVHINTAKSVLLRAGMLNQKQKEDDIRLTFPSGPSEQLFEKLVRAVPVAKIPQYIGCSRTHAIKLVEDGFLSSVISDPDDVSSGRHKGVDIDDIDCLIEKMRRTGEPVITPSKGMASIGEVAASLKIPAMKVLSLLLDGQLDKIELLPANLKFLSVLVCTDEIAVKTGGRTGSPGLTVSQASMELMVEGETVKFLLRTMGADGEPMLKTCGQVRHMGIMRDVIDCESVQKFKDRYCKLSAIDGYWSREPERLRSQLALNGITPVWDPGVAGAEFYRVCEI